VPSLQLLKLGRKANRYWLYISLVWFLVQGSSLTYPTIRFWDDYLYYAEETATLPRNVVPNPGRSQIESLLLAVSPGSFRVAVFLLLPISAILLHRVLGKTSGIVSEVERRLITTTFLFFFPWGFSLAVILTLFNYVLALTGFMFAWNAVISTNPVVRWLLAPILFVFSFRLPSLILFTIFPLTHSLWISRRTWRQLTDRVVLALVVIASGSLYYPVLEVFGYTFKDGYNQVLPSRLVKGVLVLFLAATVSMYGIVRYRRISEHNGTAPANVYLYASLASLMFGVAAFPYLITGHLTDSTSFLLPLVPGAGGYTGRHLILFAFPLSVLSAAVIGAVDQRFSRRFSQVLVMSLALLGVSSSIEWKVDALKQQAAIQAISQIEDLGDFRFVFVNDRTSVLNAKGRDIRSYEKEGWVRQAGGNSELKQLYPATSECSESVLGKEIELTSPNLSRIRALVRRGLPIVVSVRDSILCHQ